MDITITADSLDDVSPTIVANEYAGIELTIMGVDLSQLIEDIGQDNILDTIPIEEIQEYLNLAKEREES